jgi:calcium-binding protein CML
MQMRSWITTFVICLLAFTESVHGVKKGRWLVLEVSDEGTEIISHKLLHHEKDVDYAELGRLRRGSHFHEHGAVSIFYHLEGKTCHRVTQPDPRVMIYEGLNGTSMSGKMIKHKKGSMAVTIPADASHITIEHHKPVVKDGTASTMRTQHVQAVPKFATQGTITDATPTTVQYVGDPSKHVNLVILAGGFMNNEKDKFDAIVLHAVSFLRGQINLGQMPVPVLPVPWDRYLPLVNVYSVFQPSRQSGASYPLDAYGNGGHPTKGVVLTDNNLNCAYGTESIRLLNCDHNKMLLLASESGADPSTTVIMTLVNDGIYGGTAGGGKASVYAGRWKSCQSGSDQTCQCTTAGGQQSCYSFADDDWNSNPSNLKNKFYNVFIHELGHAQAKLSDEYSYNIQETGQLQLYNCWWSSSLPPWQHWISQGELAGPTSVCSYTNYFKPTAKRCLMGGASVPEMCAACAEVSILSIFKYTSELAGARCPRPDETLVIVANDDVWTVALTSDYYSGGKLRLRDAVSLQPHAFKSDYPSTHPRANANLGILPLRIDKGEILTEWKWPSSAAGSLATGTRLSGTIDNPSTALSFSGNKLGVGMHVIQITISDNTQFVKKDAWSSHAIFKNAVTNMDQTLEFTVKVVSPGDSQYGHCTRANLDNMNSDLYKTNRVPQSLNECPSSVRAGQSTGTTVNQYYCGVCATGKICNDTFARVPFETLADVESAIKAAEEKYFLFVLPLAGGAVVGCIVIAVVLTCIWKTRPHSVIPFPLIIKVGRAFLLILEVLVMAGAIAVIAVTAVTYQNLNIYGKGFALIGVLLAGVLYIVAFFGFLGAWNRSRPTLTVACILTFILFVAFLACLVAVYWLNGNLDNNAIVTELEKVWLEQVATNPGVICRFQSDAQCTGFARNCLLDVSGVSAQCPERCEITNTLYVNPCWVAVKGQLQKYYQPASLALLIACCVIFLVVVMNGAQCCLLRQRSLKVEARLVKRTTWAQGSAEDEQRWAGSKASNIMKNLNSREQDALKAEFKKVDKNGDGKLTADELRTFFSSVCEIKLKKEEITALLSSHDLDGDGKMDFNEFILMHQNDKADTAAKEKELNSREIKKLGLDTDTVEKMYTMFHTADKDGTGMLTVDELALLFKKIQGKQPSQEELQHFMKTLDSDDSGAVNFVECCTIFKQWMVKPTQTQVHDINSVESV